MSLNANQPKGSATSAAEVAAIERRIAPTNPVETPQPDAPDATTGVIGEGSYEGTRDYAASIDSYMRNADIDDAVQAAVPNSASDEGELLRAEAEGASRTKAPGE